MMKARVPAAPYRDDYRDWDYQDLIEHEWFGWDEDSEEDSEPYQPYLPGLEPEDPVSEIIAAHYLPWIREHFFNQTSLLLKLMEPDVPLHCEGKEFTVPIHVRANNQRKPSGDVNSSP